MFEPEKSLLLIAWPATPARSGMNDVTPGSVTPARPVTLSMIFICKNNTASGVIEGLRARVHSLNTRVSRWAPLIPLRTLRVVCAARHVAQRAFWNIGSISEAHASRNRVSSSPKA